MKDLLDDEFNIASTPCTDDERKLYTSNVSSILYKYLKTGGKDIEYTYKEIATNCKIDWEAVIDKFKDSDNTGLFFNEFYKEYYPKIIKGKYIHINENNEIILISHNREMFFFLKGININLLTKLHESNPKKYNLIHKGTPYCFLGLFSLLTGYCEEAVAFMNSAVVEDKKYYNDWRKQPAMNSFTYGVRKILDEEIKMYNMRTNNSTQMAFSILEKIVIRLNERNYHSIVTTLYSFVFEKENIKRIIHIMSKHGGSIEPILMSLFKGSLVFESLLKTCYQEDTISRLLLNDKFLEKHFDTKNKDIYYNTLISNNVVVINSFKTFFADSLDSGICKLTNIYRNYNNVINDFIITARIRNTTAHSLNWDTVFNDVDNYETMYNHIINAIFFVLIKETDKIGSL